jgi:hypothetical protein
MSTVVDTGQSAPVPVRDFGFTVLHKGGAKIDIDLIFIHGIQGHPAETWASTEEPQLVKRKRFLGIPTSRSRTLSEERSRSPVAQDANSGLWLATLLHDDFPNARILTYGYDSHVSNFFKGSANKNDIITIANGFLNELAAERSQARGRPMIIVSHSMGGLITKEVGSSSFMKPLSFI